MSKNPVSQMNSLTRRSVSEYAEGVTWGCTDSKYLAAVSDSVGTGRRGRDASYLSIGGADASIA